MADNEVRRAEVAGGAGVQAFGSDQIGSVEYMRGKTVVGADGTANDLGGRALGGSDGAAAFYDPRAKVVRLSAAPTIVAAAYAAGDVVGTGYISFANAVRISGGSGIVTRCQVADKAAQRADLELHLFDRDLTATSPVTDNAPYDPIDADLPYHLGFISVYPGGSAAFTDNAVYDVPADHPFLLNGTTLYGLVIARSATTYASASDLTVNLTILQD